MHKRWEMVAYERRETLGEAMLWTFDEGDPSRLLIYQLAVPVPVGEGDHDSDPGCGPVPDNQSDQDHSHLLHLTVDIVLLIADHLDLNSLYTLSHCCWNLRSLLSPEVSTRFRRALVP